VVGDTAILGALFTTKGTVADTEDKHPSLIVTVYVPVAAIVTAVMVGF
jgi:hypothetical protein